MLLDELHADLADLSRREKFLLQLWVDARRDAGKSQIDIRAEASTLLVTLRKYAGRDQRLPSKVDVP